MHGVLSAYYSSPFFKGVFGMGALCDTFLCKEELLYTIKPTQKGGKVMAHEVGASKGKHYHPGEAVAA